MVGQIECRYGGRDFTREEMTLLRRLLAREPPLNRTRLSQEFCRQIGWRRVDGKIKDASARVALRGMDRDGLIALPPPLHKPRQFRPMARYRALTAPPLWIEPTSLDDIAPLELVKMTGADYKRSRLWNEFIERYHYLGYKRLFGAQMRYSIHARDETPVAMIGFGASAWKIGPRDSFIGWSKPVREANLCLIVNNSRFLILPWARPVRNLGSHILARVRQQLPRDWHQTYGYTPLLMESFVEVPRFRGTVYRAAGWTRVGTTQGRGRNDRHRTNDLSRKDIWLRSFRRDWRRLINRPMQ